MTTKEDFEEVLASYPGLYKEAAMKLITETSYEFAMRYLDKCVNMLLGTQDAYLGWSVSVRRALDCYMTTQGTDPNKAQLKKIPAAVPLLYVNAYGQEFIDRLQKECGVERWSPCCDVVIRFLDEHKLTLDDVVFETHWGTWKGENAEIYQRVVTRGAWNRGAQQRYLFVATKRKAALRVVTVAVTFEVQADTDEEASQYALDKLNKLHDQGTIRKVSQEVQSVEVKPKEV